MNSESSLVYEVWELFREYVPASKRNEYAISMLRSFEEFGIESSDLHDLIDEDDNLTAAYHVVFEGHDDEDEEEL